MLRVLGIYLTQYNKSYPIILWKFNFLGEVALEKSLMKYCTGGKEKWTNNSNDKYEDTDSFSHDTSGHIQNLYQI